jgi:hypothetical protein
MAVRSQPVDSAMSENAATISARLGARLADVTQTIYHTLTTEIPELRDDPQTLDLMGSNIEGNVDTIFHALQYEIPLERVRPPTAALEYARRLAQRGVPVNAAALLGKNLPEARAWVGEMLGPLSADSENDARLRETLRIFLRHGTYKTAAEELNLHFNSVKYRVLRAAERRGKPIGDDRLDVELALLICHWFGTAVLEPVEQ